MEIEEKNTKNELHNFSIEGNFVQYDLPEIDSPPEKLKTKSDDIESSLHYSSNEAQNVKYLSTRRLWRKNFFTIIFYVKIFVNKLKKKIPNSKYLIEQDYLKLINDSSYFYNHEGKKLEKLHKGKNRSKFNKVNKF